jgi:hypothetical protein
VRPKRHNFSVLCLAACFALAIYCAGCDTSDPMENMYNRPSPALADPMHYSPDMENADVTGGSIGTYNDKAMKQDVDEVVNP